MNNTWVGSLTDLKPNRGYEIVVSEPISEFYYVSTSTERTEPSLYVYGCTHPSALNFDPSATIDDGQCDFELPIGWTMPNWSTLESGQIRSQAFVIFMNPLINQHPLQPQDAIAAFAEGQQVGLGFPNQSSVTVAILNVTEGTPLAFALYDHSSSMTIPLNTSPTIYWTPNGQTIAGCMDPTASNYLPDATIDFGNCQP